jgi:hypothetical protein
MEQQLLSLEDQHVLMFVSRREFLVEQTQFLIKRAKKDQTSCLYDTILPEESSAFSEKCSKKTFKALNSGRFHNSTQEEQANRFSKPFLKNIPSVLGI